MTSMSANYTGPESPSSLDEAGYASWDAYLRELEADAGSGFCSWEHFFAEKERISAVLAEPS
jgi:hypothetical protein